MKTIRVLFWISLAFFILSFLLLLSGSSLLVLSLGGQAAIPLGNLTTALGILAFSVLSFCSLRWRGRPNRTWHRYLVTLAGISIGLSVTWWPVGRMLSGNWSNTFINQPLASWWFWNYSYTLVGFPLVLLLLYFLFSLFKRTK